jgi:hypothetical protein
MSGSNVYTVSSTMSANKLDSNITQILGNLENKILYLFDCSGSVRNNAHYHDLLRQIFDSLSIKNHQIIGWNHVFYPMSDEQFITINNAMVGNGGTLTSAIAQYILTLPSDKYDVVIVTDGIVDTQDIMTCDTLMSSISKKGVNINSVISFICSNSRVNFSVLAPFLRNPGLAYVFHGTDSQSMILVHTMNNKDRAEILAFVQNATTIDDITTIYDRLMSLLSTMMMGKTSPDPSLRSMICETFARIKSNIIKSLVNSSESVTFQREFYETKNLTVDSVRRFVNWYKSASCMKDFTIKLNSLLQICDARLSTVFDPTEIRRAALARATIQTVAPSADQLVTIETTADSQNIVECPVMMGSDYAMGLMIKDGAPLFSRCDKAAQDFLMKNTFSAIGNTPLIELLKERMDHSISLQGYIGIMQAHKRVLSPTTRSPISVIIPLGADPVSVKAANYAIGQFVLGQNGIIGNPNVWFYICYHTIKNGGAPWLESILPLMEKQLIYRMDSARCQLSHSGLSIHIQANVSWGVALRFILSQIEIDMPKNDSSFPIFSSSIQHIITLLEMYGCVLPESIYKYCTVVRYAGILVNECKRIHLDSFRVKYTSALIRNFYQVGANLSPEIRADAERNVWFYEYIPLDGQQTEIPAFATDLSADIRALMYNLASKFTTESTTVFTLMESVDYNTIDNLFVHPVTPENDWLIYTNHVPFNTRIHPETMRPYSFNKNGDKTTDWKTSFVKFFNGDAHYNKTIFSGPYGRPCSDVFCGSKMYASFIEKFRRHPTLDDFIMFCFATCKNSQYAHKTIPCVSFCEAVLSSFEFSRVLSVDEFLIKYNASSNRVDRLRIESGCAPNLAKITASLNLDGLCFI